MPLSKCIRCKGKKSAKDPHNLCPDCVSPCDLTHRCDLCINLSLPDFSIYLKVLRKRRTQRITRAKMSQDLQLYAEDDGRITPELSTGSPVETSVSSLAPPVSSMDMMGSSEALAIAGAPHQVVSSQLSTSTTTVEVHQAPLVSQQSPYGPPHHLAPSQAPHPMSQAPFTMPQAPHQMPQAPHPMSQAPPPIPPVFQAPHPMAPHSTPSPLQAPSQQQGSNPNPWQGTWTHPQWNPSPFGYPPFGFPFGWPPQASQPQVQAPASQAPSATLSVPPSPNSIGQSSSGTVRETKSSGPSVSRDRSRSPVRTPRTSGSVDSDSEEVLGLDEVVDWVADNLGSLCPSPGTESDPKKELRYEPHTQLPLHPVAWDLVDSLNEEFGKLSLDGSFKSTASLKKRYPVHSVDFLDTAAKLDEDVKYVTGSSASSGIRYKVSDASIASLETESKKAIRMISALASSAEAVGNNLDSDSDRNLKHVQATISWMMRGFTDVITSLRQVWAGSVTLRRRGCLSLSSWEEAAKKKLLRQPVDKPFLFNEVIESEQKRLGELAQAQVALRAIKSFSSRSSTQPPRRGNYQGRRRGAFRGRGGSSGYQGRSRYFNKGGYPNAGSSGKREGRK